MAVKIVSPSMNVEKRPLGIMARRSLFIVVSSVGGNIYLLIGCKFISNVFYLPLKTIAGSSF